MSVHQKTPSGALLEAESQTIDEQGRHNRGDAKGGPVSPENVDQSAKSGQAETPAPDDVIDLNRRAGREGRDAIAPEKTVLRAGFMRTTVRRLVQTILPLIVLAVAFYGFQYLKATKPAGKRGVAVEQVYAVRTVAASRGNYQPLIELYGATVSGRQVDIRSLVSGRVVEVDKTLREGGEVAQGTTLIKIDPFDFQISVKESKAQLAEALARKTELEASLKSQKASIVFAKEQLDLAKKDVDRARPLVRRGTVSQQAFEQRKTTVSVRKQALDTLQNDIAVWQARIDQQAATADRLQASVAQSERRLQETVLKAPFNAYVTGVTAQVGRTITANDTVATLIDRDWIEARFVITNEQYGRIIASEGKIIGRPVDIVWRLGGQKFKYAAEVTQVGAQINSQSGGIEILARIVDPLKPTPIRPGAFVELSVRDKAFDDVFRVPAVSLYQGNVVYVVRDDRLQSVSVKVLGGTGADLLIQGEIEEGAQIITTRLSKPGDGVRVDVQGGEK